MKKNLNISIHHIGGRAGTMEFSFLAQNLENNITRVLYDADDSCLEQVNDRYKVLNNTVVLPYCISNKKKVDNFYLTADRYESSLIRPKRKKELFVYNMQFQFDHDMTAEIDEKIKIDTISLDKLFKKNNKEAGGSPDYLSLDVEGAELTILKGAKKLLKSNILSVNGEFHSFSECNKLINFCKKYGFYISNIRLSGREFESSSQMKIGLQAKQDGLSSYGVITFLKKNNYITKYHKSKILDLLKVSFLSFVDFNIDKMYQTITIIQGIKESNKFINKHSYNIAYISFIKEFIDSMKEYPPVTIIKFSTIFFTTKERSDRFTDNVILNTSKIRKRYFKNVNRDTFKNSLEFLSNKDYVGIEIICKKYGFEEHANNFRTTRINAITSLLIRLGFAYYDNNNQVCINEAELLNL